MLPWQPHITVPSSSSPSSASEQPACVQVAPTARYWPPTLATSTSSPATVPPVFSPSVSSPAVATVTHSDISITSNQQRATLALATLVPFAVPLSGRRGRWSRYGPTRSLARIGGLPSSVAALDSNSCALGSTRPSPPAER